MQKIASQATVKNYCQEAISLQMTCKMPKVQVNKPKVQVIKQSEEFSMKQVGWKKVSHFEGPEYSPGFLLWQVSTKWRREVETVLQTLDLTHPQFVILASVGWLTRNGEQVTQVELARHCETDITMTSQVLRVLERKGYIERKHREGDERSKFPALTKKGGQLIEKAIPLVESVDNAFFGRLKRDTKKFVEILQQFQR